MADGSKIEWTDATWNPIRARRKDTGKVGWHCERVSPACAHCYAAAHNGRMLPGCGTGLDYTRYHRDQVDIFIDEPTLLQPLKWRKPRKVFVCSMTDLFGEFVSDEQIQFVFGLMSTCGQHTFQVLTKRPDRMARFFERNSLCDCQAEFVVRTESDDWHTKLRKFNQIRDTTAINGSGLNEWPLPNVWLGTTVENQEWADRRIPELLKCPAAVRFLSCEPMLGEIDLSAFIGGPYVGLPGDVEHANYNFGIDWIIAGGESGRGRRRMDLDWPRYLRDQCVSSGVPFFMKQIDKVQEITDDLMIRQFPAVRTAAAV